MLVDNALSPELARKLANAGYDTLHVRDVGLASADDDTVLRKAREEGRVLISRDGDFAAILARTVAARPSFVHLRTPNVNRPEEQLTLLQTVLPQTTGDLIAGAIVTVRGDRFRVRLLPVAKR